MTQRLRVIETLQQRSITSTAVTSSREAPCGIKQPKRCARRLLRRHEFLNPRARPDDPAVTPRLVQATLAKVKKRERK